ncbi:MAG: gamma-glutamyltransferase [Acidobacteriota bacterium]|nr:gamma-glutamyltransferase [Acidobacteriota bacterium]
MSPTTWRGDYDRFMAAQLETRSVAGAASGRQGAVTVAYNGLAARAGLVAMKQGGNAIDALMTAAVTQVALTAGAPISYFGIMSLVYYEAATGTVHTMNAEWNTVRAETEPLSIPGGIDMSDPDGIQGKDPSGRTALVGGFMKGVGAAHARFGKLAFDQIFAPAIHVAEEGMEISDKMAGYWQMRHDDLARLGETRETMLKPDGSGYVAGDIFRQPALAATLRAVVDRGVDYMYTGPWAERAIAAIQADGGRMTMEDLRAYDVLWSEPLVGDLGDGWEIHTNPKPNNGGVSLIEAQHLARVSGMLDDGHWTESAAALRKALDITQLYVVDFIPATMASAVYPGVGFSAAERIERANAAKLWAHVANGKRIGQWDEPPPHHSDDVVAIDSEGNIAAITQSINCVIWGKTALVVDGITIGDPASFQQLQIQHAGPGQRLESPTETGVVFKDGEPVLGFASMGSGLHQRTFQGLLNFIHYGMTVDEAIDTPDFFMPTTDPKTLRAKAVVPRGRFPKAVLEGIGYGFEETSDDRFAGEGLWVAISRDPKTGELRAASHNRNNSAAVAW